MALGTAFGGPDYDQIVVDAGQATADAVTYLTKKIQEETHLRAQADRRQITAIITVGAEAVNVRALTIQFQDGAGNDLNYRITVPVIVLADANGDAFVGTGGSTGIAIGTDGALIALVAKKVFLAISEADGDLDLTWTDTGTEVAFLGLVMPDGRLVISAALTNT